MQVCFGQVRNFVIYNFFVGGGSMGFTHCKVLVASSKNLLELLERIKKNDSELRKKISSAKVGRHIKIAELLNDDAVKRVFLLKGEAVIFYPAEAQEFTVDVFSDTA